MLKENYVEVLDRKEVVVDKRVFVKKKVDLCGFKLETPTHMIFIGGLKKDEVVEVLDVSKGNFILEANRFFRKDKKTLNALERALSEYDSERILNMLRISGKFIGKRNLAIITAFQENPLNLIGKDLFGVFLDYIHEYSGIIFVPNIRYGRKSKRYLRYSEKEYKRYIEFSLKYLMERNSKPIVFPLDIDFPLNIRKEILSFYKEMGVKAVWVDFKGKNSMTKRNLPSVRNMVNLIEKYLGKDVLIFFANVKKYLGKESVISLDKIPPSDALMPFAYGDIIGSPEKKIGIPPRDDEAERRFLEYLEKKNIKDIREYKIRKAESLSAIFDRNSYYYRTDLNVNMKLGKRLIKELESPEEIEKRMSHIVSLSNSINSVILNRECDIIKKRR